MAFPLDIRYLPQNEELTTTFTNSCCIPRIFSALFFFVPSSEVLCFTVRDLAFIVAAIVSSRLRVEPYDVKDGWECREQDIYNAHDVVVGRG